MKPSHNLVKSIHYCRKSAMTRSKIRRFIYDKLAKHYEKKHEKEFISL